MSEQIDKKSFIAYKDWEATFSELDYEQAGKLVMCIFAYVRGDDLNDLDQLTRVAFSQIKATLDRDHQTYQERIVQRNRENGKKGGRPPKNPKNPVGLSETQANPSEPKKPDNVNDSVIDNVNDNVIESTLKERKADFKEKILSPLFLKGEESEFKGFFSFWAKEEANGLMKFENKASFDPVLELNNWRARKEKNSAKKEKTESLILPWEEEQFIEAWEYWKEYKSEQHGFKYKSEKSEQASLVDLSKKANGDMDTAIEIISQSVSNAWKGFFALKEENMPQNQSRAKITGRDVFLKGSKPKY